MFDERLYFLNLASKVVTDFSFYNEKKKNTTWSVKIYIRQYFGRTC